MLNTPSRVGQRELHAALLGCHQDGATACLRPSYYLHRAHPHVTLLRNVRIVVQTPFCHLQMPRYYHYEVNGGVCFYSGTSVDHGQVQPRVSQAIHGASCRGAMQPPSDVVAECWPERAFR